MAPSRDSCHEHSDEDESSQNISLHRNSDNDDDPQPASADDDDWMLSKRSRQSALVALAKKRQEAAETEER